jgi:hypothetical protein
MRPVPRRHKRLAACALACAALIVAGSVAPAFGGVAVSPNRVLKLAQQALRVAKRANTNASHALAFSKKPGPTGPQGPRGSEGLDGPQGSDGYQGPRGATGPAGATGSSGPAGPGGATGATGVAGPEGPEGPEGPKGAAGTPGATGPQGPRGYARAFATVDRGTPALVGARTAGVTGVNRPSDDRYCLSLASEIDVALTSPVVSVDLGRSSGTLASLFAAIDSTGGSCAQGELAVVTAGAAPNAVSFTIVVP